MLMELRVEVRSEQMVKVLEAYASLKRVSYSCAEQVNNVNLQSQPCGRNDS